MPRRVRLPILSADVPPEIAAHVRAVAAANRTSVSAVIRAALRDFLEGQGGVRD
jgi:hypothetical protein